MVIVDCHGHFTTAPPELEAFRQDLASWAAGSTTSPPLLGSVSDDAIRQSIESTQLRIMDVRGVDLTILSPRASSMDHHVTDERAADSWARTNNDLVSRVVSLFPTRFAAACQLPQTPRGGLEASVRELRRCVLELGSVGCLLNPDPSGGFWQSPPLTNAAWYPLYEAMIELDVPAMIHVAGSQNPAVHTLGAHYLNADTTVFMQLAEGRLFERFPTLRFVIPHGGGAVPFHWGRLRGLAARFGYDAPRDNLFGNVFFDTSVYDQAGFDHLISAIGPANILFASEMFGAVRGVDPETGYDWDDTKRYLDAAPISDADRRSIAEVNARRVYPRLDARLPEAVGPAH